MALGELGKLAVIVRRQVVTDLPQLFVDDVEVVDEPLGCRRDRTFFPDGTRERAIRGEQDLAILGDASSEGRSTARIGGDHLCRGERGRVLLEPLDAEELGDDRFFEAIRGDSPPSVPQPPASSHPLPSAPSADPIEPVIACTSLVVDDRLRRPVPTPGPLRNDVSGPSPVAMPR